VTTYDLTELGRPIKGPQAFTGDWRRFWHLTFNIAKTNWKMRFFGSALGIVWQVIRPLMLFGVLYVFFTKVAHIAQGVGTGPGQPDHFYGAQLLGAIVLFTYLQEATMGAVRCVVDNEVLVRKLEFPRMVIPLSAVLLSTFNVSLNLVVVLVFALIEGVRPMLSWVEIPLIVAAIALLAVGLAMLLSSAFVYFRDIQPIWEVVLQVAFYASGVMLPIAEIAEHLANWCSPGEANCSKGSSTIYHASTLMQIYMVNPMTALLQQFKHAGVNHASYGSSYWAGGAVWMAIPAGIILVVFVSGVWVFNRVAPYVAENL
jgi:ABC-2 type transport system permease protein